MTTVLLIFSLAGAAYLAYYAFQLRLASARQEVEVAGLKAASELQHKEWTSIRMALKSTRRTL